MKIRIMAVVLTVALSFVATLSTAQAKVKHKHHNTHRVIRDVTPWFAINHLGVRHHILSAKRHTRRHVSRQGACDGFQRCRCGVTQANYFGLPLDYNGHNLKTAIAWVRAFSHTSAQAGVVMYQRGGGPTGHVSRIVELIGNCTATVSDDTGTYERNICSRGAVFMDVQGGGNIFASAKTHRRDKQIHYANADDYMKRAGAGI